eukprot:gene13844-16838_t
MKNGLFRYYAAGISAFVIWGAFAVPLKLLKAYPSSQILEYRIFTALILVSLFILLFRRAELKKDLQIFRQASKKEQVKLAGLILLSSVLLTSNWFTYIYAVNHVSLTSAAFAYMVCPLITAFGGFFILKEHLSRDVLWSVAIASVFAFYLIIQRAVQTVNKVNMLALNLLISALLMLPYYLSQPLSVPTEPVFWGTIVLIALIFTLIPLLLNLFALIKLQSSTLGIIMYVNPIIAFLIAFCFYHEPIRFVQLLAYALLVLAIVVFNWSVIRAGVRATALSPKEK